MKIGTPVCTMLPGRSSKFAMQAVRRRDDTRVREIELGLRELRGRRAHRGVLRAGLAQRTGGLLEIGLRRLHRGGRGLRLRGGGLRALLGDQFLFGELQGALFGRLGVAQLGTALRHRGAAAATAARSCELD